MPLKEEERKKEDNGRGRRWIRQRLAYLKKRKKRGGKRQKAMKRESWKDEKERRKMQRENRK